MATAKKRAQKTPARAAKKTTKKATRPSREATQFTVTVEGNEDLFVVARSKGTEIDRVPARRAETMTLDCPKKPR
jgi:hypothetical protein